MEYVDPILPIITLNVDRHTMQKTETVIVDKLTRSDYMLSIRDMY